MVIYLEKEMAPHSSTLAWKIPWMEEPGRLQSMDHKESDTTERLHLHLMVIWNSLHILRRYMLKYLGLKFINYSRMYSSVQKYLSSERHKAVVANWQKSTLRGYWFKILKTKTSENDAEWSDYWLKS